MTSRPPIVEDGVIAGTHGDKYETRNPLARWMVGRFLDDVSALADRTGARHVHEVGCGEGHVTARLGANGRFVTGSDFSSQVVEEARRRAEEQGQNAEFVVKSVYDLRPPDDSAELVACLEVLEHLEQPELAVELLARLARPWLLASVPREPLWRVLNVARGKYLRDWGNTPGHLQHWSTGAFLAMLRKHAEVVEVRTPLPWTIALCRVP